MKEIIEALKAAGYTYKDDYVQPEFDYPWMVFIRDSDGAFVVGNIIETATASYIVLDPEDRYAEWKVEDIPAFIEEFKEKYEEFWVYVNR